MTPISPHDLGAQAIADEQNGNITYAQLRTIGFTWDAIRHRVGSGRLIPVYKRVYAVGRPPRSPLEWAAAAVLACGSDTALTGLASLAAWGLRREWPLPPFDVIVPRDVRIAGIRTHRVKIASDADIRRTLNTHVVSPALALLETAPILDARTRARAVNDARNRSLIRLDTLGETLDRFPYHPGRKLLLPFLERPGGATDSDLEDDMYPWFVRYDFPIPEANVTVAGHRVDFLFRDERLIIECDGWTFHRSRESFEDDRDRDADTLEADHVTVRITKRRIQSDPDREAARLWNILRARRRR